MSRGSDLVAAARTTRLRCACLVLALCASTLAGCSAARAPAGPGTDAADVPVRGGAISVGLSSAPASLDSAFAASAAAYSIARAIYDPLFQLAPDGSLTPMLATGYTAARDQRRFTVTLRDGLRFSDGTPLDGAAVVAHYRRLIATPGALIPARLRHTTISAQGDVITFRTAAPWSQFPQQALAGTVAMIGSAAAATADPAHYAHYPIAAGPFTVQRFVGGAEAVLVRNRFYWRPGLPYLDRVTVHFLPNAQTRMASVISGNVDFMVSGEITQRSWAVSMGLATQVNVGLGPVGIMLNSARGPLADRRVRVALAQAIDTDAISTVVYHGLAPPATGLVPPRSAAAHAAHSPRYDLAAARRAIAAYGKPVVITLTVLQGTALARVAALVAQMWHRAGVRVTIARVGQSAALSQVFVHRNFQAYLSSNFYEGVPVSQSFVLFLAKASFNPTGLHDPRLARAYAAGMAARTPAQRMRWWSRCERVLVHDAVAIPIVQKVGLFAWNDRVHGVPAADAYGVQAFDVAGMWVSH